MTERNGCQVVGVVLPEDLGPILLGMANREDKTLSALVLELVQVGLDSRRRYVIQGKKRRAKCQRMK